MVFGRLSDEPLRTIPSPLLAPGGFRINSTDFTAYRFTLSLKDFHRPAGRVIINHSPNVIDCFNRQSGNQQPAHIGAVTRPADFLDQYHAVRHRRQRGPRVLRYSARRPDPCPARASRSSLRRPHGCWLPGSSLRRRSPLRSGCSNVCRPGRSRSTLRKFLHTS